MVHGSGASDARDRLLAASRAVRWRDDFPPLADVSAARQAAVLVLFGVSGESDGAGRSWSGPAALDVLLLRRAATLRSHPSEMSFPGGRVDDADADICATALREAQEETGLDPAGVEVLAVLPEVPLPASNHRVTPVLAWWRTPSPVRAVDAAESVEVLRLPVERLLEPSRRFTSVWRFDGRTMRAPAFDLDGGVLWGFTAMVLDRVMDAAGWSLPWDRADERPIPIRGPVDGGGRS